MNTSRKSSNNSKNSQSSFIRSLCTPNLDEMLQAPLADLIWGTVEADAVADAIDRVEALLHHIELRQRVVTRQAESFLDHHAQAA